MEVRLTVSDDDRRRVAQALDANADPDRILQLVAQAGATEAVDYATGRAVFSTMSDLRSYRIYRLICAGMTLGEAEMLVARLFKVPDGTARRLVNAAVSRYSIEIAEGLLAALCELLGDAEWNPDVSRWEVSMPAGFIRNRVLDILRRTNLPDPSRADRGAVWRLADETYQWLRQEYGLDPRPPP